MSVELPKDAEGREIPLDVDFLYSASGELVKPYSFTFNRYDGFGWDMRLVGVQNSVYDPESFYLTPPDSWEKLLGDLGDVLQQGGRSGHPACVYLDARGLCRGHMDKDGKCKLSDADCCVSWMVSNIRGRIKRLCAGDGDRDRSEK